MQLDAASLRDFYRTPLGQVVRRQLASRIRGRLKKADGLTIMGAGFATPYLGSYRSEAKRLGCLMPARQGAIVWPAAENCHSVLVEEQHWPLPDNSVDRIIAVHLLEGVARAGTVLREIWRVLAPDGRLILVVPNRRGVWSRIDATPFGHGLPFSRDQLEMQLTDALFTPVEWSGALFFPPIGKRLFLKMAPALERSGSRLKPGVAGVIIVEARKEMMAPVRGLATQNVRILRPAEVLGGQRRSSQDVRNANGRS
jgi:SAM-dependent methyltransferase